MTILDPLKDINTLHIHSDELPWVKEGDSTYRLLQARESDNLVVTNFRTAPGTVSPIHRHLGPVLVYTIEGTWSHRPEVMDYRPGTYVCEPVEALHRYYGGPSTVECIGFNFGDNETFNAEGEMIGRTTLKDKVARYFALCEEQGFGRPNLLTK
jgi:quercetin dioxygenase-like cupin family protein